MKKTILLLLGWAAAAISPAAQDRTFVLAPAGEVEAVFVAGVRAYLEEYSGAAVRLAPAIPVKPDQSLEEMGRQAAATLGAGDHSIVVLARPGSEQPQGVCLPDQRFAVLNLARLEAGADAAQLARRTGQEGLRVLTMLLGLAPCPFPLCVLVGYEKTEDLDRMSSNFCPPCRERFLREAGAAGLRLIPEPDAGPADVPSAADEDVPAGDAPPPPGSAADGELL